MDTINAMKKTAAVLVAVLVAMVALGMAASPTADAAGLENATFATGPLHGTNAECPFGSIEDSLGKCRKPVADALACPKGALGVPGACYIFVDKIESKTGAKVCPRNSIEDSKELCRKPVANVTVCPTGALGVPGACYVFVDKVLPKIFQSN